MNRILLFVLSVITASSVIASETQQSHSIIPLPQSVKTSTGEFALDRNTRIYADSKDALENAKILHLALKNSFGLNLRVISSSPKLTDKNVIVFKTQRRPESATVQEKEAYSLVVNSQSIAINGSAVGQFYGVQSLLQMLPVERVSQIAIKAVEIHDEPRFAWRGLHFDVGRNMQSVEFIKKLLDQMAVYKLNTFHWHLTEDQGWRIEIKKYPKLTQVGGFRKETVVTTNLKPYRGDGVPYGGFYTQKQVKEVIAHAKSKHIMVVPEIELPGHSVAALAAYPELACTPGPFEVATTWGIFEDILCPSEKTFAFLEDVLTEVINLFPAPYIHIGGDEAPKARWKASPLAQEVIKREGLKDEHELQSYFIRRVEKFINSKGKRIIGWDEILEGGLAPNATVMSWRGEAGGIAAAKEKHDVIMAPKQWVYFDYGQGPREQEFSLKVGATTLEKVYSYNPVPSALTPEQGKYVRGVQGNIWTEYIRSEDMIEYMVFPRLLALAEVAWSPQEKREFKDFEQRLTPHYRWLDQRKVKYRIPRPVGLDNIELQGDQAIVNLKAPVFGSRMFVTVDGSTPDATSPLYQQPLRVTATPSRPVTIKVLTMLADGRRSAVQQVTVPAPEPKPAVTK